MIEHKGNTTIKERSESREEFKEPQLYRVYVLNDDFTTFRFVSLVLMEIFSKTYNESWEIARSTHNQGKGLIGTFTYDVAKTKVEQAKALSRSHGYPLNFTMTPADNNGQ